MNAAAKTFFSSPRFAVAGASSDPRKFGHKGAFKAYLFKKVAGNQRINSARLVSQTQPTRNTT